MKWSLVLGGGLTKNLVIYVGRRRSFGRLAWSRQPHNTHPAILDCTLLQQHFERISMTTMMTMTMMTMTMMTMTMMTMTMLQILVLLLVAGPTQGKRLPRCEESESFILFSCIDFGNHYRNYFQIRIDIMQPYFTGGNLNEVTLLVPRVEYSRKNRSIP